MKVLLGLCVVLLLGGCNRIHTDHPLFFASDARDAPRLRDGLWLMEPEGDCRVDTRKPVHRWPDCASGILVRGNEMLGYEAKKGEAGTWQRIAFVLAAGDPLVLQIEESEEGKPDYQYFGVDGARDTEDRIIAFTAWPALCGPPPPPAAKDEKPRYVTLEPLPGLTVVEDNCTAEAGGPVVASAKASRAWTTDEMRLRWIRDTYP